MRAIPDAPLAELTTLRVGGPARRLIEATSQEGIAAAVREAQDAEEPLLVLGGGSNLLIADAGFGGTVLRILTSGMRTASADGHARVTVAAGESWDGFVARCVSDGLAGCEALSGIPGSVGAVPIQNVGAYGQQVSDTIVSVRVLDRRTGEVSDLPREACGFAYRASRFRGSDRRVVLEVTFELERSGLGRPVRYAELARELGVDPGDRVPLDTVRQAVLELRRRKGMVIDPADPDSVSAGSFFLNPILTPAAFAELRTRAGERLDSEQPGGADPPAWPEPDGRVKTSAAWLIERAGFHRGYARGSAAISSKHTLALVNRGGASAREVVELAREIRAGVADAFGVTLHPEPTLVGIAI